MSLFCSCVDKKLTTQLNLHAVTQKNDQISLRNSVFSNSKQTLNWNNAKKAAIESNPNISNARAEVKRAHKRKKEQWFELIPNFHVFANLNKSISEISDLSKDDIDLTIASNIKIPNPFRYYAQAYALALNEISAQLNYTLQQRRTISQLYTLFLNEHNLGQLELECDELEESLQSSQMDDLPEILVKINDLRLRHKIAKEQHRTSLNLFFNTPNKNWRLVGSPPNISYKNKVDQLAFDKGFGHLGTQLQSVQIESSVIQTWNARFQRAPSLNIGVSAPPVYNETRDDFQFSSEDFGLFTGLGKSIKPYDILDSELMENAELRAKKNRELLLALMEKEISQLEINKTTYKNLMRKETIVRHELKYVQSRRSNGSLTENELTTLVGLQTKIKALKRAQLQIELQFWIWDDEYWN